MMTLLFSILITVFSSDIELGALRSINEISEVEQEVGKVQGEFIRYRFSLAPEDIQMNPTGRGRLRPVIKGLHNSGVPGGPEFPQKVVILKLPPSKVVKGARIIAGKYREIKNLIRLSPVPQPVEWRRDYDKREIFVEEPEFYSYDGFIPGEWLKVESGRDRDSTYLILRIFPLQYIPDQKKAVILTEAAVEVYIENENQVLNTENWGSFEEEAVIISPEFLIESAESLRSVHTKEGIYLEIITTEWIEETYTEAEDPSNPGYAYTTPDFIKGYNYSLAKKIVSFLRDGARHPNLRYVVLFGDADIIPPSYYFNFGALWENWVPSDFFYASPDYDYIPNYSIGRLAVGTTEEAEIVVDKIKAFENVKDWSWFSEAVVAGGVPFGTDIYYGEIIALEPINLNYFEGFNINKLFYSDDNFTSSSIINYFSDENAGIIYHIGHGSGESIWFDDNTSVSSQELLNNYVERGRLPIVASVACYNAAFDEELIEDIPFNTSFGEGVLLSSSGGIAYIGGVRSNVGVPSYHIEKGMLVIDRDWYITDMFKRLWESYSNETTRLGDMLKTAAVGFVANNDMSDIYNQLTLYGFTLLGDPLLGLPQRESGISYTLPEIEVSSPSYYNIEDYPVYHRIYSPSVGISAKTNSPAVVFKSIDAGVIGKTQNSYTVRSSPFSYEISANDKGFRLIRAITEDKKETRAYLYVSDSPIIPDGDKMDWEMDTQEPVAQDPDDFSPNEYEVLDLYITDDEDNWFIGFSVTSYPSIYGIAIDSKEGGFSGIEGVDKDAFSNWITFSEEHPVDYELYLAMTSEGVSSYFYSWSGSYWLYKNISLDARYSYEGQFVEVQLPKTVIDTPDTIFVLLFSSGFIGSPAQDACPSDNSTYTNPHWGKENANTLSNFVMITAREDTSEEDSTQSVYPAPKILRNYPNPSVDKTIFNLELQNSSPTLTSLVIYDVSGRVVRKLIEGYLEDGIYRFLWDGKDSKGRPLPSGVFIYDFSAGSYRKKGKIVLIR